MRNYDATIISQYFSSPILTQILSDINDYIDPDANLEAFFNCVWNVDTAVGYGLDVWGRIVGLSGRSIVVPVANYFGFTEGLPGVTGWDQGQFYNGQMLTTSHTLDDEAYRLLIFAKAAANITDGSIPAINQILMNLFPDRGNAYVTDGRNSVLQTSLFGFAEGSSTYQGTTTYSYEPWNQGDFGDFYFQSVVPNPMTMVYTFTFPLQPFEVIIVTNFGVLPKPAGVLATVLYPGS